MAAPTGATLPLPSKTQVFHLIRPVCALGTFPSRGRLEMVFFFLAVWFLTVSAARLEGIQPGGKVYQRTSQSLPCVRGGGKNL